MGVVDQILWGCLTTSPATSYLGDMVQGPIDIRRINGRLNFASAEPWYPPSCIDSDTDDSYSLATEENRKGVKPNDAARELVSWRMADSFAGEKTEAMEDAGVDHHTGHLDDLLEDLIACEEAGQ